MGRPGERSARKQVFYKNYSITELGSQVGKKNIYRYEKI